ncbi:MAG: Sodium:proton antiporter [Candidatus Kapaibacterium sp.]|nr:MAG: Sodium:proton antiporter [Candidatus Kapabacteria bacterium]
MEFASIPVYANIPFVLMLLSIAVLPLTSPHFWESNRNKLIVSLVLGIPTAIWLLVNNLSEALVHSIFFDYVPFIILLGALFVISGGIYLDGDLEAKPSVNLVFLLLGSILASLMGTTGAAMLLIRPLLKTNFRRKHKTHIVLFFIALVANCGGLLTPLGDPPLFILYLRGVPFFWFLTLVKEWALCNAILLTIFYFIEKHYYKKEKKEDLILDLKEYKPIKIRGKINLIFLLGVVLSVAFINPLYFDFIHPHHISSFVREIVIITMAVLSLIFTKKEVRESNRFNWHPIEEVAFLFFGIFITMTPALLYLETHAREFGFNTIQAFYYASGALSSFLDNTPTAVTFYSLAKGLVTQQPHLFSDPVIVGGIPEHLLEAISTGCVFFGSMTYIGNGPNFMVKAIAEYEKVPMPHFFEYMYKFSLIILLPVFIIVQLLLIH